MIITVNPRDTIQSGLRQVRHYGPGIPEGGSSLHRRAECVVHRIAVAHS